jgi:hypothetical protein
MNIAEILKNAGFPEDGIKQIEEAFSTQVDAKASEKLQLEVANALTKQETEHKEILKKVYEAAEAKRVADVKAMETKATAGLKAVIEKHEKVLTEKAVEFRNQLEQQVSDFLDENLATAIPDNVLAEAAQNNIARKILEKVREVAGMDDTIVKGNIKKAIVEGKKIIDDQASTIESLKKKVLVAEAIALIETKTVGFPQEKKDHIKTVFKGKGPKFIAENFDYVASLYERNESTDASEESRRTRKNSVTADLSPSVVTEDNKTPKDADETDQTLDESADPFGYLDELKNNW